MIQIENINIIKDRPIIKESSIAIKDNKITLIRGPSGSGKTLLLYGIGLFEQYDGMKYSFDGIELSSLKDSQKEKLRSQWISFVFQDNPLIEDGTVLDNLKLMDLMYQKQHSMEEYQTLLDEYRLDIDFKLQVKSLSRGQRQRLSILLALLKQPKLLILDEPTSYLDEENIHIMMSLLNKLKQDTMIVIASHDEHMKNIADHIYEIKDAKLVPSGEIKKEAKQRLNIKKQRVPRFIIRYSFFYIKHHIKNYISIFILTLMILLSFILTPIVSQTYIRSQIDQYKEDYYLISLYKESGFDSSILDTLNDIDHVQNSYFHDSVSVMSNQRLVSASILYPEIYDYDPTGIYLDASLDPALSYTLSFNQSLSVLGILDESYIDPYTEQRCLIGVPYELIKDKISKTTVILFVDSIENIFSVHDQIKTMDLDALVSFNIQGLHFIQQNLEALEIITRCFSIVLFIIGMLILYGLYYRLYGERYKELQRLKGFGLMNHHVLKMILLEQILLNGVMLLILIFCPFDHRLQIGLGICLFNVLISLITTYRQIRQTISKTIRTVSRW